MTESPGQPQPGHLLKKDLYMSPRQPGYFKQRLQEMQQRLWAKAREGWTDLTSEQERRTDMTDRTDVEMATTGRCNELACTYSLF